MRGTEALLEIAAWDLVEFAYDELVRAAETISVPWDEALIQEVVHHKGGKSQEGGESELEEWTETEAVLRRTKRGFFGALRRS